MNFQLRPHHATAEGRLPFECVALLLQGGGALGAYQGGVYEALAEANVHPDWIAGISIGAINAAIIAGNPPNSRIDRLREFWTQATSNGLWDWSGSCFPDWAQSDQTRSLLNQMSANLAASFGAAGFFSARAAMPWLQPGGSRGATSFYDTKSLKHTLERLVDFDRLNAGITRYSAGAVNVRTGNFVYFDTKTHTIRPEHIMASGALPPGFPAVEIDGEHYWDGGLVSNTPLQWVIESDPRRRDTLLFQVDLWSSQGQLPRNLAEHAQPDFGIVRIQPHPAYQAPRLEFRRSGHRCVNIARFRQHLEQQAGDALQVGSRRRLLRLGHLPRRRRSRQLIQAHRDGLAQIHRAMFPARRDPHEPVAMRHILVAQPVLLGAEQQGRAGVVRQMLADQTAAVLEPADRMLDRTASDGRCSDDERAIGDGVGDGWEFARTLQEVSCFDGRFRLQKGDVVRVDQAQIHGAEVAHCARGRADVQRVARRHQNHGEVLQHS